MKVKGRLITVILNDSYRVVLIDSGKVYVHQHMFENLQDAVALLRKVRSKNQINLMYWKHSDIEIKQNYLIRNRGKNKKAHIWLGDDTACKMFSTGGLNSTNFKLHHNTEGKEICTMCLSKSMQQKADKNKH